MLKAVVLRRKIMIKPLSDFTGNMVAFWVATFVYGPMMLYAHLLHTPAKEEEAEEKSEAPQVASFGRIHLVQ